MIHPLLCNAKPNFYPRSPCGERLQKLHQARHMQNISIHALLAESDSGGIYYDYLDYYFYPRSPCGERHVS